jgi:hypothetical protein
MFSFLKQYSRTLFVILLGAIITSIGYSTFSVLTRIAIAGLTLILSLITIYERRLQLKQDENSLIIEMKDYLNHDFLTNHSESEEPVEAQELDRHFGNYDKAIRHKAIAAVFKVNKEKVKEMLDVELELSEAELNILRINKY